MNASPPDMLALDDRVKEQIDALGLEEGRPLIISDADEVLLQFVSGLEAYLERRGLWLDLQSFALTGNIRRRDTNERVPVEDTPDLLKGFFASETASLVAVPGAAEALEELSTRAQIVVLTNVPFAQRDMRTECLTRQGITYPVIANIGLKGGAVRMMADRINAPVFFLDDLPHNLDAVAKAHEDSRRIHFIADERLAKLLPPSDVSHFHTSKWDEASRFIHGQLDTLGH
ncbi:hypothetical protein ACSHT0_01215 [Tepidicaulis sp. LMO-SS28]|uniref:hypothetical protein n=1 Tax=Tepidicaulis sp. LMO-SS28 TaxID=3447455 RepID=UPI003EDFCAA9